MSLPPPQQRFKTFSPPESTFWLQLLPLTAAVRLGPFSLGRRTTWNGLMTSPPNGSRVSFISSWLDFLFCLFLVRFTGFDGSAVWSPAVGTPGASETLCCSSRMPGFKWTQWEELSAHGRLQSLCLWHDVSISHISGHTLDLFIQYVTTRNFLFSVVRPRADAGFMRPTGHRS